MSLAFWVFAALLFVGFLYLFSSILLPFVAGMALAYLLDPIADRLERLGLSRVMATVTILVIFLLSVVIALIIIGPIIGNQLVGLAGRMPDYLNRLQELINSWAGSSFISRLHISPEDMKGSLGEIANRATGLVSSIVNSLWNGGQAVISVVSLMFITPIVAFYMLLDWDHMVERIDSWLPRDHVETIRGLFREMDGNVSKFVRGQVSVSTILGLFYAISLTMAGLSFGLVIGLLAGLISFIPYFGSIIGGALAIGVALVQFWPDWTSLLLVAGIFGFGQFVEGNVLQPKLIGTSVGLHPVWLMFALFAFGGLFGFVGLLVAVPAAAAVGVLVRFAIAQYLSSAVYRGKSQEPEV